MLSLAAKFSRYIKQAHSKIALLVGVVTSVLSDELDNSSDWIAGALDGTPGTDYPMTTLSAQLLSGTTASASVVTTAKFSVGASGAVGYLVVTDGAQIEVMSYSGSTGTTFTGLSRGLFGYSPATFASGSTVLHPTVDIGAAPDYNLTVNKRNWYHPAVTGGPPTARMGAKVVESGGSLYMFGGFDGTNYLNDLWKYVPSTDTWTELSPTGGPPGIRAYHTMVSTGTGGTFYVCGGHNGAAVLSDTWKYVPSTNTWSTNVAWNMLAGRHSSMGAWVPGSGFYIFGGLIVVTPTLSTHYRAETHRFIESTGWVARASHDSPRGIVYWACGSACYLSKSGKILIVGTNMNKGYSTNLYDPALNTFTGVGVVAPMPSGRAHPTLVYDAVNNLGLLYGGEATDGVTGGVGTKTLYAYNPVLNTWDITLCQYSREIRTRHVAAWITATQEMFAWGGATSSFTPTWPAYTTPMIFRYYWPSSLYATRTIDLGSVPTENGEFILEDITDTINGLTSVEYTAEYSDDAAAWTDIGTVYDGLEITDLHRYWKVHINMINAGLNSPASIQRIDALHDIMQYYCLSSVPVGDYPAIVDNISSLTTDIDMIKGTSSIGSMKVTFLNTGKQAEKIITESYPKGKTVKIKMGFIEDDFEVVDYELVYKGIISDWSFAGNVLSISLEDYLGDLKKDIPYEDVTGIVTALVYNNGGIASNPVDIMLDILQNQLNIPDRNLDLNSFQIVRDDASITGWEFNRTISSPTDAYGLIIDLCKHIGAVITPRENGKLALQLLDVTQSPVDTWDEKNQGFKKPSFSGEAKSIKNWVSTWWHWDGSGDDYSDFEGIEVVTDSDSIAAWGLNISRTKSKWLGDNLAPYNGDTLAAAISDRILDYVKNGMPRLTLETNLSAFPVQVGDLVRVRMYVLNSLEIYRAWQAQYNPSRDLAFVDDTGRFSLPYLTYDCAECVDMKFWVMKKNINFYTGNIKWDLLRAREVPLDVTITSQAEFYGGTGSQIDLETTAGAVVVALDPDNSPYYFATGTYEIILDVDQQPEQDGVWTLTVTTPAGTSVAFEAWASELGLFQGEEMSIGAITTASAITLKARYYKVKATLTANGGLTATPQVNAIQANFANG